MKRPLPLDLVIVKWLVNGCTAMLTAIGILAVAQGHFAGLLLICASLLVMTPMWLES